MLSGGKLLAIGHSAIPNRRVEQQARVEMLVGRAPQQLPYAVVCLRSGDVILRVVAGFGRLRSEIANLGQLSQRVGESETIR